MASTEAGEPAGPAAEAGLDAAIVALEIGDLPGALALSISAHWNQNEADWRMMLALGQGWGIRDLDADKRQVLAASVIVLPYGGRFGWVSMVLVRPEFKRRGHATRLLRYALGALAAQGMGGVLDATPAGHEVYVQEGFVDTWGFARYRLEQRPGAAPGSDRAPGLLVRPLRMSDWPAIEAIDTPAFGASRMPLLRALAQRLPAAAQVAVQLAEHGGRLCGFMLGRDGREASQIGPLVAIDTATAAGLIDVALHTLQGPLQVDLPDRHEALRQWFEVRGFVQQRPFTRMVHGRLDAPGRTDMTMLMAGPELG